MTITCPVCGASSTASGVCSTCGSDLAPCGDATGAWKPSNDDPAATTATVDQGEHAARTLPLARFGRFELLAELGAGAFGSVYKATDLSLERVVALKIPKASRLEDEATRERFMREARSAARLSHPNIVPVYEVGQHDSLPYLVSEFIDGPSLASVLAAKPPSFSEATHIIAALADGLHYAHELGVVHRDVKPANVLIDPSGTPRLTDFGLAKREATDATLTTEGQVLGTPSYMSPEQARGESHRADRRTDVYALGAMLYQLLTGEVPFRGNARMVLLQVLTDDPRPPRGLNDRVPQDLETIALKCLEKDPGRRYQTAKELADDLRNVLNNEPIAARPPTAWDRARKFTRRNRGLVLGTAATMVALLLGVAGTTYGMVQAREEAKRANEAANREAEETRKAKTALARAEKAEADRNAELALAKSAKLAAQRGQWQLALQQYREALAAGTGNEIPPRLGMLECYSALNDFPAMRTELAGLVARPDLGEHRGMVLLYRGILQFYATDTGVDPITSLREALDAGLPPAEESYVQAVLSPNLPAMIEHLQTTLRHDPFHVRGHDLLTFAMLLSGRLAEARDVLTRFEQLAPNSLPARTTRVIERAVSGDLMGAHRVCDEIKPALGEDGTVVLRSLAGLLHDITREDGFWESNSPIQLRLVNEFASLGPALSHLRKDEQKAAGLSAFNVVRLGLFRTLSQSPFFAASNPSEALAAMTRPGVMKSLLKELKQVIPMGFLDYAEGQILQAEGNYVEAEAAYRRALVTPSLIPATRRARLVLLGVIEANAFQGPPAERTQRLGELRETLREVFRNGPYPVAYSDLLIRFALEKQEPGLALAWAEDWVRRAPNDPKAHEGLQRVEESLGAWGRVRANLHRQLEKNPSDPTLLNSRVGIEITNRNYGRAAALAWDTLQKNPGNPEAMAALQNLPRAIEFQLAILPCVHEKLRLWECVHLAQVGQHRCAAAALAALPENTAPGVAVAAASVFSRCATAAFKDETLSPEERNTLTRAYVLRAVELLQKADGQGYLANPDRRGLLQSDPDLVPILRTPDCPASLRLPGQPNNP